MYDVCINYLIEINLNMSRFIYDFSILTVPSYKLFSTKLVNLLLANCFHTKQTNKLFFQLYEIYIFQI